MKVGGFGANTKTLSLSHAAAAQPTMQSSVLQRTGEGNAMQPTCKDAGLNSAKHLLEDLHPSRVVLHVPDVIPKLLGSSSSITSITDNSDSGRLRSLSNRDTMSCTASLCFRSALPSTPHIMSHMSGVFFLQSARALEVYERHQS